MTLDDSVHTFRLRVMARAHALGNVTQACRDVGISRTLFYRWRRRYTAYGAPGLHPRRRGPRRGRPSTLSLQAERTVLALALAWPTWGPMRLAVQLARPEHGGWRIAPATIYRLLRRMGLPTRFQRLAALEVHSAQAAGLLTERTRQRLTAAQRRRGPHVAAQRPGELLCLDTFYIGKLKGVGKVWQYTACDAACSCAIAQIATEFSAAAAARFLHTRVRPAYRAAGWALRRILTDQGNEHRGAFDQACQELRVTHTRTRPRHAWTNGFVERLQGTILTELWRVEFRRRFFTSPAQLQVTLDRYLGFYNHQRSHLGYRTRGQPPAAIFWHSPWGRDHDRVEDR